MDKSRKRSVFHFILLFFAFCNTLTVAGQEFTPGQLWLDDQGKHINAHGGGILKYGDRYYWFGEAKDAHTTAALVGVNCYSSRNLYDWKNEGVALAVSDSVGSDIEKGCIMERPKVIYNKKTRKFVMWFHLELKGKGYGAARAGVAVADKVTGPYRFLRSARVNAGKYPMDFSQADIEAMNALKAEDYKEWWTPTWRKAIEKGLFLKRDFEGGQMARDMTLFVDDDGKAYHIFASEDNLTLHIAELSKDFTSHTGKYVRVAAGGQNEAPAIFRHQGMYWMITSGCTGWAPNEARMFSSKSIWGPWKQYPSPCVGEKAKTTFDGQSTYILPVSKNLAIFMADIWRPKTPDDSRYVWLPIDYKDGVPVVEWRDKWSMSK